MTAAPLPDAHPELTVTRKVLAQMTTRHRPRSKTIWGRSYSNVPALIESIELRDLSRANSTRLMLFSMNGTVLRGETNRATP
jgi:hypothetical protein